MHRNACHTMASNRDEGVALMYPSWFILLFGPIHELPLTLRVLSGNSHVLSSDSNVLGWHSAVRGCRVLTKACVCLAVICWSLRGAGGPFRLQGSNCLKVSLRSRRLSFCFSYYSATVAVVFNIKELWGFWTLRLSFSREALLAEFQNWVVRPHLGLQRVF